MKKILLSAALVAIALSFGGCAKHEMKESAAPAGDTTKQAYENAIAAAKSEQKKAAAVGGEWRDTGKMIKSAEEAAAAGDYGMAKGLADKAAAQGRLGQEQAASQVNAGNPSYLY
jgi:hypothetical protein